MSLDDEERSQYIVDAPRADRRSPFAKPQIADRDEHVKWEYHDFVGKYHLRKIKSEFPIPGLTVTRKMRSVAAAKDHKAAVDKWIERTQKSNTAGVKLKMEAAADFLTLSDTGRASERVLAALAPAIEKRAEAFHNFKHRKNLTEVGPYLTPHYEEDDLKLDYRRVDPRRDFRYGIMPKQRQQEIHHLNTTRHRFDSKPIDVLTADKLITAVAGRRGPPPPSRETKTRQLTQKYHRKSRFASARTRRKSEAQEIAKLMQREELSPPLVHNKLARAKSESPAPGGDREIFRGHVARAQSMDLQLADLREMYSRPTTATVATREFRRRKRFM